MAKLPERQKATLLLFRRANPDEILLVAREVRRAVQWALPSLEVAPGASLRDAARAFAMDLQSAVPLQEVELGLSVEYRVKEGPHAGEWTERFLALEVPPESRSREGRWFPHYEAKASAGADAPRVREAITRLRERARLKP